MTLVIVKIVLYFISIILSLVVLRNIPWNKITIKGSNWAWLYYFISVLLGLIFGYFFGELATLFVNFTL